VSNYDHVFPISGICQASTNIFFREIWKFLENIFLRHSGSHVFEHVLYGNPHAAEARLAPPFAGFNGDAVLIVHGAIVKPTQHIGKAIGTDAVWSDAT
jgi:hypothetical protein